jgi:AraC-like DNA-binding protein
MSQSGYLEVAPPPQLRAFVDRLWVHRIEGPPPADGRRLLPDGRITLVWIAGHGVQIAGPQTQHMRPADLPQILAFGASFHPGAAPSLLRTPATALVDEHVPLDAVDARLASRLDARLGEATSALQALTAFAAELGRSVKRREDPDPALRHAIALLDRTTTSVAGAAEQVSLSERELQRRFSEHVGYGPKTLQRVLRFQRFMQQLATPRLGLAGAAALAGYADQPHLTRESRRLAGLTPTQLLHWTH